jgi:hypothetical protein
VVAGSVLAKRAEHLGGAGALRVLTGLAVASVALVTIAGFVALPSFVRSIRADGWGTLARHLRRAIYVSAVGVVATVGLVAWAHTLPATRVERGTGLYGIAFAAWGALGVMVIVAWCVVVTAAVRRAGLTDSVAAVEARLAVAVGVLMVAMTVTSLVWWSVVGGTPGPLGLIVATMVVADATAGYGLTRQHRLA